MIVVLKSIIRGLGFTNREVERRLGLSRSDLSYKLLKYELRKETTAPSQ